MTSPTLTLHHFPGACSQVAVCALEEAGLAYTLQLVNITTGDQSRPDFLAISPMGKVPTLLIDGTPLIENAAILTYIATLSPGAGLLPDDGSPLARANAVGGLAFCGGTLHPIVRGIANPARLTTGDGAPVREMATTLAAKSFGYAERRLAERGWWLGQRSIVDVYLHWAFATARKGGMDASALPVLSGLAERLMAMPGFARMQDIETESRAKLGL